MSPSLLKYFPSLGRTLNSLTSAQVVAIFPIFIFCSFSFTVSFSKLSYLSHRSSQTLSHLFFYSSCILVCPRPYKHIHTSYSPMLIFTFVLLNYLSLIFKFSSHSVTLIPHSYSSTLFTVTHALKLSLPYFFQSHFHHITTSSFSCRFPTPSHLSSQTSMIYYFPISLFTGLKP